jgi:hypothetical protein
MAGPLLLPVALSLLLLTPTLGSTATSTTTTPVHTVHLIFSHHLDVGLDLPNKVDANCVGFATKIVQRYFDIFIPRAIRVAAETRQNATAAMERNAGPNQQGAAAPQDRLRYSIHPWIGNLYVNCVPWSVADGCSAAFATIRCPSPAAVAAFDEAVTSGDLVYAHSPFNIDPEVVGSPSVFKDLVHIAGALDDRYVRGAHLAYTHTCTRYAYQHH